MHRQKPRLECSLASVARSLCARHQDRAWEYPAGVHRKATMQIQNTIVQQVERKCYHFADTMWTYGSARLPYVISLVDTW
jgi:hypothetical protein